MARVVIVTSPALEPGFRLAGVETRVAATSAEAAEHVRALLRDEDAGVVAVHAPYLRALDPDLRRRLEESVRPVVVAVPEGAAEAEPETARARLAASVRRAVGFRLALGPEAS